MSEHAEYAVDDDGIAISFYCTDCSAELGVDLSRPDREPAGCHRCGSAEIAWETWNVETHPSYPHDVVTDDRIPLLKIESSS